MRAEKNRTLITLWWVVTGMLCCISPGFANADSLRAKDTDIKFLGSYLSVGVADRSGELQWNIASNSSGNKTPNILSELTYADLEIDEVNFAGGVTINKGHFAGVIFEGYYATGDVKDGSNQDSDYAQDNRKGEYSRSLSEPEGSEIIGYDFSVGYHLPLSKSWSITPKIAYTFSEQSMKMRNGVQVIDTRVHGLSLGPFSDTLNSHYTAEWEGIWIGSDLIWRSDNHQVKLQIQAHINDYYAEADWNLREDFDHPLSFAQWAEGEGTRLKLHYQFQFSKHFAVWLEANREDFEATNGRDVVYFADGTRGATRLNKVTWEAKGFSLGLKFSL